MNDIQYFSLISAQCLNTLIISKMYGMPDFFILLFGLIAIVTGIHALVALLNYKK